MIKSLPFIIFISLVTFLAFIFFLPQRFQDTLVSGVFLFLFVLMTIHICLTFLRAYSGHMRNLIEIIKSFSSKVHLAIYSFSQHKVFHSKIRSVLILEVISVLIYHKWLSFTIFVSGDYHWIPANNLAYLKSLSAWRAFVSLGEPNWVLWSGYLTSLFGVFGDLGFDSNVVMNVLVLWFIVLIAPLISFFFIKRFTRSNFTAVAFSLFLLFNSYVLTNVVVGHILLSVAFYTGLLAFTLYSKFVQSKLQDTISLVLSVIVLWITGVIDFRVLYLLSFCLAIYQILYFVLNKERISPLQFLLKNLIFGLVLILLNINWLLPTLFIQGSNDILARPIFGKGLLELFNSWSVTYYYWSLSNKIVWGVNTGFPVVFMFLPLLVIMVLYFSKKTTHLMIFSCLFIIGVFLGKQNTAPFARLYELIFQYFPGFSAFRDSSKFFQISGLSLPVILAIGYENIQKLVIKNLVLIGTLFIVGINIFSFVWFQDHMFVPASIPDYYDDIAVLEEKSASFERVMWVPRNETVRTGTVNNPRLTLIEMKDTSWSQIFQKNGDPQSSHEILTNPLFPALLAMSSTRYLFVPEQLQTEDMLINDDAFYYDDNRPQIIEILDNSSWVTEQMIESNRANLYRVNLSRPHIYVTDEVETLDNVFNLDATAVPYEYVNSSIYNITLENVSDTSYLSFTDSYSHQWTFGPKFISPISFAFSATQYLPEDKRLENEAGANVFIIDRDIIIEYADEYTENPDGSVNATLSLYYSPQKKLIIGNLITVATVVVISLFLVFSTLKKMKRES